LLSSEATAVPTNSEKTTICRISFLAMASKIEVGTRWVRKPFRVKASVVAAGAAAAVDISVRFRPWPGCSRWTISRPSRSETAEALMNQQHGLGADAADGGGVFHVGDAGHQGGEDQRRDDHLDQPQEDVGDHRQVAGRALGRDRVEELVTGPADRDPEDHGRDDQIGEALVHAVSSGAGQA
jgi:hypothetical protein